MAVGDDAAAYGYPLVPPDGEGGRLYYGDLEINRTRDMIAELAVSVPTGKANLRIAAGITSGTDSPSAGTDGDIYFQILS